MNWEWKDWRKMKTVVLKLSQSESDADRYSNRLRMDNENSYNIKKDFADKVIVNINGQFKTFYNKWIVYAAAQD